MLILIALNPTVDNIEHAEDNVCESVYSGWQQTFHLIM